MRGIFKSFETYIPYYQSIANINRSLSHDLLKFYERYPSFKGIAEQLMSTFRAHNESIDIFVLLFLFDDQAIVMLVEKAGFYQVAIYSLVPQFRCYQGLNRIL